MATKTDNQSELRTVTTTVPSTESSTATGTATTTTTATTTETTPSTGTTTASTPATGTVPTITTTTTTTTTTAVSGITDAKRAHVASWLAYQNFESFSNEIEDVIKGNGEISVKEALQICYRDTKVDESDQPFVDLFNSSQSDFSEWKLKDICDKKKRLCGYDL